LNLQDLVSTMGEGQERLARAFKALGDETRLRLIAELARRGEVTCGEGRERGQPRGWEATSISSPGKSAVVSTKYENLPVSTSMSSSM
jgi:DNA-binding transcriptional ArsR family regulator